MARFEGGWVKIKRRAFLGDINSNFTRGGLFGALVSMANIQDSTVSWRGRPRKLERGEIVTSIQELADLGDCDRKTIDKHLLYLVLRGTITMEKSRQGVLIKLLNFNAHQGVDADGGKRGRIAMEDAMANGMDNGVAHIEEVKNERKEEGKNTTPVFESDPLIDSYLKSVSREVQSGWLNLYPDHTWIVNELRSAVVWLKSNPARKPKSHSRFFTNWLKSGWKDKDKPRQWAKPKGPPAGSLQRDTNPDDEIQQAMREVMHGTC